MYKAIALDLDGTLTNSEKVVTQRTVEALLEAQRRGVKVILCSGRPVYGMEHIAEQLHMGEHDGYVIAFNGGKAINWRTKEVVMEEPLPDELVPELFACAEEAGLAVLTYRGRTIVTNRSFDRHVMHNAYINRLPLVQLDDFLSEIEYPVSKCLIVGEPERVEALEQVMQPKFEGRMGVFRSQPFFLECVSPEIDKAKCLDAVLRHVGIAPEELIACGDAWNDITMVRYAGLGVAMANSCQELLNIADYVTLSNDDDGIAHVVDKFLLGEI